MQIHNNLQDILGRIQSYATESNFPSPTLLAVSKAQPIEKLQELKQHGWKDFGENYLQDLEGKAQRIEGVAWHFIGQLQSRKIPRLVELCESIHSVSNMKHAKAIDLAASKLNKKSYPVFLAVNAGEESGKSGVFMADVKALADSIERECPNLQIEGIMSVPPREYNDKNYTKPPDLYRQLRQLADQIGQKKLSLGMSNDLRIAVLAGSNIVRIGTSIFGERSLS